MDPTRLMRPSRSSGCSKFTDAEPERRRTATTLLSLPFSRQASLSISYGSLHSQWEILMRKFSQDCKSDFNCQSYANIRSKEEVLVRNFSKQFMQKLRDHIQGEHIGSGTCESRPLKRFSTGSSYEGTWDAIGICGYGIYTFPNGVVYEGEFEDNMFHGDGAMRYPDGTILKGKWSYGEMMDRTIVFADGVHYKDHSWTYCKPTDRRYACEFSEGIQPADQSFITNNKITKEIPDGTYDVGDGFYDPNTGNIFDYDDHTLAIRMADSNLRSWIKENCRVSPDDPLGPQPELYKQWVEPTLKAAEVPTPACLSNDDSVGSFEQQSILSGHTEFTSMLSTSKSRASKSSWSRKTKMDQGVPVDSFRPVQRQCSRTSVFSRHSQISRLRHKLGTRDMK